MNEVQCTGHERSLWNCRYKNITAEDCKHTEDASVRCNVPYMGNEKTVRATQILILITFLLLVCYLFYQIQIMYLNT